jgi:hypothetical protein
MEATDRVPRLGREIGRIPVGGHCHDEASRGATLPVGPARDLAYGSARSVSQRIALSGPRHPSAPASAGNLQAPAPGRRSVKCVRPPVEPPDSLHLKIQVKFRWISRFG